MLTFDAGENTIGSACKSRSTSEGETMNKVVKILLIFLLVDIVVIGGYFGFKALSGGGKASPQADYEWTQIDEYYYPKDYIEEFIKKDAEEKGMLPVLLRNYGKDLDVLKRFRGKNFAGPGEAQLKLRYRNLEDWQLVELKFTAETGRESQRAILYVQENGEWKVGDSGVITQ
jgi:hypothetical protein